MRCGSPHERIAARASSPATMAAVSPSISGNSDRRATDRGAAAMSPAMSPPSSRTPAERCDGDQVGSSRTRATAIATAAGHPCVMSSRSSTRLVRPSRAGSESAASWCTSTAVISSAVMRRSTVVNTVASRNCSVGASGRRPMIARHDAGRPLTSSPSRIVAASSRNCASSTTSTTGTAAPRHQSRRSSTTSSGCSPAIAAARSAKPIRRAARRTRSTSSVAPVGPRRSTRSGVISHRSINCWASTDLPYPDGASSTTTVARRHGTTNRSRTIVPCAATSAA